MTSRMSLKRPNPDLPASSPPPNKRPATNVLKDTPCILLIHERERRRTYFYIESREHELSLRFSRPWILDNNASNMPFKPPTKEVWESVWRTVQKSDVGGYLSASWNALESTNQDIKKSGGKENEEDYGHVDLQLAQSYQDIEDSLCSECMTVVTKSEVLNRPWRKIISEGTVKDGVPQEPSIMEAAPWTKNKVNAFPHHRQLGFLRRSALNGCHLCSLIDADDPTVPLQYDERSTCIYTLLVIFGKYNAEGPGVIVLSPKGAPSRAIKLTYGTPEYKDTPTLHQERTDSEAVIGVARKWLETCLNGHEACSARAASAETKFLPTRLVEITRVAESIVSLRLVPGRELGNDTEYLTLSHCWGRAKFVTLTKDNLAAFEKEIPFFQLPKNFRDAAIVTEKFGYKYIWIDSLCIIQGCEEDWKEEAAKMGSVYRHSVCTIAALGSHNGNGGCFQKRSHKAFVPCQLVPQSKEKDGVYADLWRPSNSLQPLHDRAWVVQERCLSIRTLNFGKEQLSWDCICTKASELEPDMQDTSYEDGLKRRFNDLLLRRTASTSGKTALDDRAWTKNWWKLVSAYSSCDLTYDKDKWPAISGLATEVENDTDRKLFYGLWSHNLAEELLWTVAHPRAKRLEIKMPSWSWMSVKGQVYHQPYDFGTAFRLDAAAEPILDDAQPALRVTARMLKMKFIDRPRQRLKHYEEEEYTHQFRLVGLVADRAGSGLPLWDGEWLPDTSPDLRWDTWALQIVESQDEDEEESFRQRAGLVVVPVPGKKDTWRRVGYYGFGWRDEARQGKRVVERFFGERKTIVLV